MYTADQYARAKAQLGNATPEQKAILSQKMYEYIAANPGGAPEEAPKPSVPELPPDTQGAFGTPGQIDTETDLDLPNASKLKKFTAPPEYSSSNPLKTVARAIGSTALDPLDGPAVGLYHEPSRKQFETDMEPVLRARGIARTEDDGTPNRDYEDAYAQYKDSQWQKAYDAAKAADTSLTRVEHVADNKKGWSKLAAQLTELPDVMSAFAKGYASGGTLGATKALSGAADSVTGGDEALRDREQAERDPVAAGAGEVLGAINPRSLASGIAHGVSGAAKGVAERYLPGMAARLFGAAAGGAAASEADLAGRAGSQAVVDQAHGLGTDDAKSTFTKSLLGTGLLGAGGGVLGQLVGEGATAFRKSTSSAYPELGPLREGGGDTSVLRGVRAPAEVKANEEAARFGIPGEAKPRPLGTPEEIAAEKLQEPLTQQNADDMKGAVAQAERENAQALASNPELAKPKPMRATANALLDEVLGRVDPAKAGSGEFLPKEGSDLAYSSNKAHVDAVKKLWKPKVVLAVEAPDVARAEGGRVISVEQAQALKYPLEFPTDSEGVPAGAPPIPDEPAGSTTAEIFGRPADKPTPWDGRDLGPRERRATPRTLPIGSEWDIRDSPRPMLPGEGNVFRRSTDDIPTRPTNSPPQPLSQPSTPAPPEQPVKSSPAAQTALAAGMPAAEFKVVMVPAEMDAQTLENQLKVVDRAAKAGTEAKVDPIYNRLQKEIRTDREQFGKDWAELKEKHHDIFTDLEQRAGAVNLQGDDPYSKMTAQQRKAFNEALLAYGSGRADSTDALRNLARSANKMPELDALGAQTAYTKLKAHTTPRIGEALGSGGVSAHLRGFGPPVRLRADALAGYLPGMGKGTLGLLTGSVYDSTRDRGSLKPRLSDPERAELQRLLDATQEAK